MNWKSFYQQAHEQWFQSEYPNAYKDGHYCAPKYPDAKTANGITKVITDYLFWTGHFANRTNNMGVAIKKQRPKMNIFSGKVENLENGVEYRKSSSMNGMQDIDVNLKHPNHIYGIPWKIEIKVGKDTHKDHQKKFGKKVAKTGAHYSVVRTPEDFFTQLNHLLHGELAIVEGL
jgi:hypothetical protein